MLNNDNLLCLITTAQCSTLSKEQALPTATAYSSYYYNTTSIAGPGAAAGERQQEEDRTREEQ